MGQVGFLRFVQVAQQRAEGQYGGLFAGEDRRAVFAELTLYERFCGGGVETVEAVFHMAGVAVAERHDQRQTRIRARAQNRLHRGITSQFVGQAPHAVRALKGGHVYLSGGQVAERRSGGCRNRRKYAVLRRGLRRVLKEFPVKSGILRAYDRFVRQLPPRLDVPRQVLIGDGVVQIQRAEVVTVTLVQ